MVTAAAELGRRGGQKGGPARAAKLSGEERSRIARQAAHARWGTRSPTPSPTETASTAAMALIPDAEERWRALVEQLPAVVYIDAIDEQGTTVYVSPHVEALLGYSLEQWRADPGVWFKVLHPEDRDAVFEEYMRHRETEDRWTMEYRAISADGREVWIREDDQVIRGDAGERLAVQGVMLDVTQQKLAEERLRTLDKTKEALLQAVSHDLRGPLAAVVSAASMLGDDHYDLSEDDRHTLTKGMVRSSRKVGRVFDNLLDMDALDRGHRMIRREDIDLAQVAHATLDELDLPPGRTVVEDAQPTPLRADPVLIERIVDNLVSNALKHTPKGSTVWLRTRPRPGGGALVIVEDDGPGVPAALRTEIFDPFKRAAAEHVTGAGIGLSLVASFAQLHGGTARVEERAGGGASFVVELPDVQG